MGAEGGREQFRWDCSGRSRKGSQHAAAGWGLMAMGLRGSVQIYGLGAGAHQ